MSHFQSGAKTVQTSCGARQKQSARMLMLSPGGMMRMLPSAIYFNLTWKVFLRVDLSSALNFVQGGKLKIGPFSLLSQDYSNQRSWLVDSCAARKRWLLSGGICLFSAATFPTRLRVWQLLVYELIEAGSQVYSIIHHYNRSHSNHWHCYILPLNDLSLSRLSQNPRFQNMPKIVQQCFTDHFFFGTGTKQTLSNCLPIKALPLIVCCTACENSSAPLFIKAAASASSGFSKSAAFKFSSKCSSPITTIYSSQLGFHPSLRRLRQTLPDLSIFGCKILLRHFTSGASYGYFSVVWQPNVIFELRQNEFS